MIAPAQWVEQSDTVFFECAGCRRYVDIGKVSNAERPRAAFETGMRLVPSVGWCCRDCLSALYVPTGR